MFTPDVNDRLFCSGDILGGSCAADGFVLQILRDFGRVGDFGLNSTGNRVINTIDLLEIDRDRFLTIQIYRWIALAVDRY